MTCRPRGFRRIVSAVLSVAMVLCMMTITTSSALAAGSGGITERDSVTGPNPGTQTGGASSVPAMSPDGRFIAFASDATTLVAGDTNGVSDVFVRDRLTGVTERVSVNSSGVQGSGPSGTVGHPSISADGRYVVFDSYSPLASPSSIYDCVYVRDRVSNTTTMVSVGVGNAAPSADSYQPSISADGKFVAFASNASNLVASDTNAASDVFVRDLGALTTTRVSVGGASGAVSSAQYLSESQRPSISGDGRYVAFEKQLDQTSPNPYWEIWVRDRTAGSSKRISVPAINVNGNVAADSSNPAISSDGAYVAFDTADNTLKGSQASGHGVARVKVSDLSAVIVSQATGGTEGNGTSDQPAISSDGRYVAFRSAATNLSAGDANAHADIFVRDCTNSTTALDSLSTAGAQGNGDCAAPALSGDGTFVAFSSSANNLVSGDTNGVDDVFARLIDTTAPVTTLSPSPAANAQGWWNSDVSVGLSATDTGSGVASTSYTVNGGGPQAYSSPFSVTAEGTTNLGYSSTDVAGNVETTKLAAIKIDKTKPTLSLDKANLGTFTSPCIVSATTGDALSGVDTTQGVEMNVDGTSWTKETAIGVPAGTHTVNARVFDKAGNEQIVGISITVNAASPDTAAPHTTVSFGPGLGPWYSQPTASFTATDDISGVVLTTYWIDNGTPILRPTSAQLSVTWPPQLLIAADGVHTIHYKSTDASANAELEQTATILVDNTPPSFTFDTHATYTGGGTIHVTPSDGSGSGVDPSTVEMKVDGGTPQVGSSVTVSTQGAHVVYARATDHAGNTSAWIPSGSFTVNFVVSLASPKVSGSAVHTRSTKFVGSVSPAHSIRVNVVIQRSVRGKWKSYRTIHVTSSSAGTWSFKYKLPKGTFRLRATTAAGGGWVAGASSYRTVKVR